MRKSLVPVLIIGIISVSFLAFVNILCAVVEPAKKPDDTAKDKAAQAEASMVNMDAIGRAESFGSMADSTLKELEAAAATTNTNQIVYLARRYERVLEAARFNVFLADRQGKDIRATIDKVEELSRKGAVSLKAVSTSAPQDAREAVDRARATAEKSRSVLYQRLIEKVRTPAAAPKVPTVPAAVSSPTAIPKAPVVPAPKALHKVPQPVNVPSVPKTIPPVPKIPPVPPQPVTAVKVPPSTVKPAVTAPQAPKTAGSESIPAAVEVPKGPLSKVEGATPAVITPTAPSEEPKVLPAEAKKTGEKQAAAPSPKEEKKSFWSWWGKKK
ncbi:MAG: hypothetical protein PHE61_05685 [Candidatus Omnitrophica bacterium]|nr:hypothetical protein [Candidatus Omnitrophota bacterium]